MSRDKDQQLKTGKADPNVLRRSVSRILGKGEQNPTLFINPETLDTRCSATLAVVRALNSAYASFVQPTGLAVSVLLPASSMESALRRVITEIKDTAALFSVPVVSGHTEVTDAVTRPLVTCAVSGKEISHDFTPVLPGDGIYFAGKAALGGTMVLALEREEELSSRFPSVAVRAMQGLTDQLCISSYAASFSSAKVLSAGASGGVQAAIWRLSEKTGLGLSIQLDEIPILQETVEFTELLGINPYEMAAEGGLFLVSSAKLPWKKVGEIRADQKKEIRIKDEVSCLNRPPQDALLSALSGESVRIDR